MTSTEQPWVGETMTGGEAVARTLEALGVSHVFGIVSVHNLPMYDALARSDRIEVVPVRHEQAAVHAADGLARATGRLGVALTSTGPGCANAMGGLFEAQFASSRVLMLTGQIDTGWYGKGKGFLHEAERQLDMLRSVCRAVESVRRTDDVAGVVARVALDVLTGRPQPGAVEIPIDLQYASAEVTVPAALEPRQLRPDEGLLDRAAEALSGAERPLIWAGGGVITAGAAPALAALAEALDAPVVTSTNGRGALPEDHPLCLGPLADNPAVSPLITEADVVLAVGTRFQGQGTRNWSLAIPGRLLHLDADPGVLGRNYRADTAIVGDARLGLEGLAKRLDGARGAGEFAARAREAAATARQQTRELIGDHGGILDAIRSTLPRDGVVVRDATVPAYLWGNRILPILEPRTSIHPTSAAIGPGLPLGVGAAAGTGRRTVVLAGDGGVVLTLMELATAAQQNLPLVLVVFNDGGYGVLRSVQQRTFERTAGVDLVTPDFSQVAASVGVPGVRVSTVEEFAAALREACDRDGPSLLDVDLHALPLALFRRRRT